MTCLQYLNFRCQSLANCIVLVVVLLMLFVISCVVTLLAARVESFVLTSRSGLDRDF